MNNEQILAQSKAAYGQWAEQWREHAKQHASFPMKPLSDLENTGIGKAVLCVANGYSFEENIDTIREHQDNVDILCCDKTLGALLDNDIIPKYCMVCDANVDFEKYMENWKDKLSNTTLIINACGNPEWSKNGNWKDIYFFINKDIIESEKEFSKISGCKNFIPAGTNVSNAMVVMLTQSDNTGRRNFFGYDKILLIGYDYSWRFGGKYYAFNETGGGKANYMRHMYCMTTDGSFAYTSGNLAFSAQWFETYVKTFNLPVIQCTGKSVLARLKVSKLEDQITYSHNPGDSKLVRESVKKLKAILKQKQELEKFISGIERDHWNAFLCSV